LDRIIISAIYAGPFPGGRILCDVVALQPGRVITVIGFGSHEPSISPVAITIIAAISLHPPIITGPRFQTIDTEPGVLARASSQGGPCSTGPPDLDRIALCSPHFSPMKVSRMVCNVCSVSTIRCRTTIAKCCKINRVAPGAVITTAAVTAYPPLIGGAGLKVAYINPGFVTRPRDIVPRAIWISPLNRIAIGSIAGFPLEDG